MDAARGQRSTAVGVAFVLAPPKLAAAREISRVSPRPRVRVYSPAVSSSVNISNLQLQVCESKELSWRLR